MKRTLKPPPQNAKKLPVTKKRPRVGPTPKVTPAPNAFSLHTLAARYGVESSDDAVIEPPIVAVTAPSPPAVDKTPPPPPPLPRKQLYGDDVVMQLVRLLRQFHSRSHLELEGKLGKWCNGSFSSGVSEPHFAIYLAMLESFRGWTLPTWKYSFDYILKNNVRCTKSSAGRAFVRKSLVEHVTVLCEGRDYDMRFSLKEEVPTEVRAPGEPLLIRVKKRKSFVYKDKLQFDLTIVWTGTNEQEAHDSVPTFEVELECLNKALLGTDHAYTATSMVEKMLDFVGRQGDAHLRVVK